MKIFNIIAIFIYTFVFSVIGAFLIAVSLRTESIDSTINMVSYLMHLENIRLGMALTGLVLILVNISIAQLSLGKLQKHKTIAFENPDGQVTVSLSAIEDYIKKLTNAMPEIKEIRSSISAGKSGIEIVAKAALYADVNIPEVTEKIQNMIRQRLQEMLGVEEKMSIKIHISKIVRKDKDKKHRPKEGQGGDVSGFQGTIQYGNT